MDVENGISADEQKDLLNSMSTLESNALFDADGVPKKDDNGDISNDTGSKNMTRNNNKQPAMFGNLFKVAHNKSFESISRKLKSTVSFEVNEEKK